MRIKEIKQVSAQDFELQAIRSCLVEEKWDNAPKQYLPVRNELTFIGHVILRGKKAHSTTGKSPAELLFRRTITSKMSESTYVDEEVEVSNQEARDHDTQKKQANKDYVDNKFHARVRHVREGDVVLLEQKRENKL